jgi:hypothetical protein
MTGLHVAAIVRDNLVRHWDPTVVIRYHIVIWHIVHRGISVGTREHLIMGDKLFRMRTSVIVVIIIL